MDFDDLLVNWKLLLDDHPEVAEPLKRRFRYILVDEYQDTNKLQADIIDAMASVRRNVMVVGDDAQSIYSFRGASFENILTFPLRFPEAQIYKLETNYRSTRADPDAGQRLHRRTTASSSARSCRRCAATGRSRPWSASTTSSSRPPSSPSASSSCATRARSSPTSPCSTARTTSRWSCRWSCRGG